MGEIVLVRHGATEWSRNGRHTGRTDLPLLDDGREDAKRLAPTLAKRNFAKVLSSPLSRALDTCKLAGLGDRVELTDRLLEWDYGEYEGITTVEIRKHDPGWTVWTGDIPGGESAADVGARMDALLGDLNAINGDIALFGHGHALPPRDGAPVRNESSSSAQLRSDATAKPNVLLVLTDDHGFTDITGAPDPDPAPDPGLCGISLRRCTISKGRPCGCRPVGNLRASLPILGSRFPALVRLPFPRLQQ